MKYAISETGEVSNAKAYKHPATPFNRPELFFLAS
jgi:hypothetical protein